MTAVESNGIDYQAITFWVNSGILLLNVVIGVFVWANRRHQVTDDRVQKVEERVSVVETHLPHMPTHIDIRNDMQAIETLLRNLRGEIGEISGRMQGVNRAVDLINQHLLNTRGN